MLQMSKLIRSRNNWREKAVQRANELREFRKSNRRYQARIESLKDQVNELEQEVKKKEQRCKDLTTMTDNQAITSLPSTSEIRMLCITLVIQGVISYRSTPRILSLFYAQFGQLTGWVPHFTSVINWTLRLGLGLLKQVKPLTQSWLAIIDHSIDVGTKKALVVLRVPMNVLSKKNGAVQLCDCECIGLEVSETVNGETVAQALGEIFEVAGKPTVIIKDCDSTLNKGVSQWQEKQRTDIPVIDDISHVMASALKAQFEQTEDYQTFTSLVSSAAKKLRQTSFSFLTPPKLRTKGRFLSIGRLGEWGKKVLDRLTHNSKPLDKTLWDKLHEVLPGLQQLKPFIQQFAQTADVISQVMAILKNDGLKQTTETQCRRLANTLPENSVVKQRLLDWLDKHYAIKQQITLRTSLLISSDIIESLFGRFKYMLERNPQADMNRSALLIPVLCGHLNDVAIEQSLNYARHDDLVQWEHENIPYTARKKRYEFFNCSDPKTGKHESCGLG